MSRIDNKRSAAPAHSTRSSAHRTPSRATTATPFTGDGMSTRQDSARRSAAQHAVGAPGAAGPSQEVSTAFDVKIAQLQRAIANDAPGASEELANVIRDRDGVSAAIADIQKKIAANEDPATWANVPRGVARAEQAEARAQLQKQLRDLNEFGLKVAKMNPTERQNLQNFFRLAKEDPEGFKRFVEGNKPGAQPAPSTQGAAPVSAAPTGAPANIQAAIDFGLSQLGAPYVGGASPYRFGTPGDGRTYQQPGQHAYVSPKGVIGYDCSGLVTTMLKKAGIDLSGKSSSRGMLTLPEVPKDQLQPGDLLVKNGHVAMFIGNGQMIESVPGGVRVADASKYINDPAYSGRHPG